MDQNGGFEVVLDKRAFLLNMRNRVEFGSDNAPSQTDVRASNM